MYMFPQKSSQMFITCQKILASFLIPVWSVCFNVWHFVPSVVDTPTPNSSNADLLGDLLGGAPPAQPTSTTTTTPTQQQTGTPQGQPTPDQSTNGTAAEESLMNENQSKSTKESILALYGSGSNQQQFGVPGKVGSYCSSLHCSFLD